ncbi:restriction endonuclease subunit S [Massilia timonae]|uniref:Type I restriction modification DNA specificity domain-containing protein n=1 Tax=Massilia timonae CCUG 45783 TaxID=883126 RepID=K9DEF8_9BURK|nr:restriction endonuclease subunit S [Massilia timonae]EKU81666.1 hypothetical protein HMPREF9710_03021 [Massilia timonae CCUG 45783]
MAELEKFVPLDWKPYKLGDVTREVTERLGTNNAGVQVFGVDRAEGLTSSPKYQADELSRYKRIRPSMFAYNPMRLNIGSIGYCSDISCDGVVSPDYIVFECDPNYLNSRYLNLVTKTDEWNDWVQSAGIGSVRVRIYYRELARMPLRLPSLPEQEAIVQIVDSIDKKISHNLAVCEKIENLVQILFQNWFVDFGPYRAKNLGANSFASFPQKTFNSIQSEEFDEHPTGWTVQPLASIASFMNGLALQKYPPRGDGDDLGVIKIADLRKGEPSRTEFANAEVPGQYMIEDGDLLFSWSGTLEAKFWFGGRGALNQHLFKVSSAQFPSWFCLMWIKHHLPWFKKVAASKATTMGHIKREHLTEAKVNVPPPEILMVADTIFRPLFDLYGSLTLENREAKSMRDAISSKLLTGKIRLPIARD